MKALTLMPLLSLVLLSPAAAWAQDPVKVDPAHYKLVFENAAVRVLKIDYPVGAKSVMHKHPDSIVILLAPAKVKFSTPDGKSEDSEMANESAQYSPAGTHNPANIGSGKLDALLRGIQDGRARHGDSPRLTGGHVDEGPRRGSAGDRLPHDRRPDLPGAGGNQA